MSTVERYRIPVRKSYCIINSKLTSVDEEAALKKTLKAVNNSVERHKLKPTLLVYGAPLRLRLLSDPPSPSLLALADTQASHQRCHRLFCPIKSIHCTKLKKRSRMTNKHKVLPGGHNLIHRPTTDGREGMHIILHRKGEEFTLRIEHGMVSPSSGVLV